MFAGTYDTAFVGCRRLGSVVRVVISDPVRSVRTAYVVHCPPPALGAWRFRCKTVSHLPCPNTRHARQCLHPHRRTIPVALRRFSRCACFLSCAGKLISEVDLEVFPAIRGTVVTTSSVTPEEPGSLVVTVESTRVANSNVLPFIDTVSVPVRELVEAVRGPGSTRVNVDITYMDSDLRITRTRPDNEIFVYRRV